jgi:hypothetical protein
VSYDLTIATHDWPGTEILDDWARENRLEVVTATDGKSFAFQQTGRGDAGYAFEVWGPDPAEPEDFVEELAEACLAPRWMLQVSVPYSVPKVNFARARSLARHIAASTNGAAFDGQEDRLLWPRGKQKRTPSRAGEQKTSMLEIDWFVAPSRWRAAVEALIPLITRRCSEALPTRYGNYEPPPHRFDRAEPEPFVRYIAESEDGDGFWYASRPSFGGSFLAPHADKYASGEDDQYRVGRLELSFDANLIAADQRWREALVELFVRGAEVFGAFFAAAQVEPGWIVSRNNRPFVLAASVGEGEHFLRGYLWQGLPPVPLWLSWYGDPYRALVNEAVRGQPQSPPSEAKPSRRRLIGGRDEQETPSVEVDERERGIFVRLSDAPQPRRALPRLTLPVELTYRERQAVEYPGGGRGWEPAGPEDRASVIPALNPEDDTD